MNNNTALHLDGMGLDTLAESALATVSGGELIPGWLKEAGKQLLKCIVEEADAIVDGFGDGFNDGLK